MLTYKEISDEYSKFSDAKSAYWRALQNVVLRLTAEFEDSLQLERRTLQDGETQRRYVEVGKIENGEFVAAHPMSLPGREDLSLPFAIKLLVERAPNTHPRMSLWVDGSASLKGGAVLLALNTTPEQKFEITEPSQDGAYEAAAEAIKESILKLFKEHQFG